MDVDRPRGPPGADELWRTLRPGGTAQPVGHGPRALHVRPGEGFAAVEGPHVVHASRRFTGEDLVGLAGTYSAMLVLPPARRAALLDEVRRALSADPRYREPVDVPVVSRCDRAAVQAPGTRSSNGSGSAR